MARIEKLIEMTQPAGLDRRCLCPGYTTTKISEEISKILEMIRKGEGLETSKTDGFA
jgi:hypothetical protein